MSAFLQNPLVFIINAVSPIILKINERIRNLIVEACLFVVALLLLLSRITPGLSLPTMEQSKRSKIIVLLFVAAAIFSLKDKVRALKLNLPVVILWYLFYLAVVVSVIIHYSYFGIFTLFLMMVVFPVFFFIWGNRGDFDTLFRMVCRPFANLYILYSLFSLGLMVFAPSKYELYNYEIRFQATTIHPNTLGMLAVTGCICCIYLIFAVQHKALRIYYGFGVAVTGYFIMLASSRTSLLCLLAAMFIILLYSLRRKERSAAITSAVLLGVFIIFSGLGLLGSYVHVKNVTAPTPAAITAAQINPTASSASPSSEEAEKEEEPASDKKEPSRLAILLNRYNPFNKSLNEITSGRVKVWETYFRHLNLTGIDYEQRREEILNELPFPVANAHNQYLQTAHTMGFFAGLFELLANTTVFAIILVRSFRKGKFRLYDIFCMAAICSFYLLSLMEYIGEPTRRGLYILFFIAVAAFFFKPNNNTAEEPDSVPALSDSENE